MIDSLPLVNACLNGLAALLLVAGYIAIKQGKVPAHKACMIAAFVVSALFLACYLTYHIGRHQIHGSSSQPFPGKGIWRPIYFSILIPHILLAIGMLPMIFLTFWRAFRGDFARHRRIARWTLPIWIYVSVTGVLVYLMLYQMDWS
ncbi:MAG: DUF420 domain-containing protein [Planctomycetota bacterium]